MGGQQQDLGPLDQRGSDRAGPAPLAKGVQVLGGDGERGCDRRHAQSCRHHPSSVKLVQRRTTRGDSGGVQEHRQRGPVRLHLSPGRSARPDRPPRCHVRDRGARRGQGTALGRAAPGPARPGRRPGPVPALPRRQRRRPLRAAPDSSCAPRPSTRPPPSASSRRPRSSPACTCCSSRSSIMPEPGHPARDRANPSIWDALAADPTLQLDRRGDRAAGPRTSGRWTRRYLLLPGQRRSRASWSR